MLKQVLLSRKAGMKRAELTKLQARASELEEQRKALQTREEELEAAVTEVTEETSEEDRAVLDAAVAEFEAQQAEADEQERANGEAITALETEINEIQRELDELSQRAQTPAPAPEKNPEPDHIERSNNPMNDRLMDIVNSEAGKAFLTEVRTAIREKRALPNVGLTIPDNMLGLVREEVAANSKLLPFVDLRRVAGTGRMNIMGAIPEAVWTEMCANINEIDLTFGQVEVDGYKVGAAVVCCNAILEDSDIALASEIISAIGKAIAKATDKAILFGTGTKTPIGIATRLAASSQPAWWGTYEGTFTDLHTSNIQTINVNSTRGAEFFVALIAKLAIAKPKFSSEGLFWAMNRKTHLDIMAKALAFDSAAALVSNTNIMPVVGGTVVEFEDDELADYEIIGGFGGNYLMAERAGIQLASSTEYRFLADQTVFKGTARYDGRPLAGEAFVIVNYNNTSPTTSKDFAADEANDVTDIRLNTHAATVVGTGTVQLHAITEPGKGTVTWATSASTYATVSSTGLVTGVTTGSAVITATCNGLTDSCTVTVSAG